LSETFILIPGRTSKQGVTLNEGKDKPGYIEETSHLQMAAEDMDRLNIAEGSQVRLTTEQGSIELPAVPSKKGELTSGILFMSYGPLSCKLIGGETHGTGMPDSKCFDVELEKVN
jgi:formylmethanofuran dehydrogenase subunit D